MNINLQEILRCPITKKDLRKLTIREIKNINQRIDKHELFHFDGTHVKKKLHSGYISSDGTFAYIVTEDISVLYRDLALVLDKNTINKYPKHLFGAEKKNIQNFYDQTGWQKGENDQYVDALKFEDLRPVVRDYIHKCHLRVNNFLKPKGKYILDAGSGPIQYPEYFRYSKGYDYRICVDISLLALREAKKKLGKRGIYILGDITNLPIRDNSVDAAVSLHVIYHIPQKEQKNAFCEINRVLKPESTGVVVYSWPPGFNVLTFIGSVFRTFILLDAKKDKPDLYFYPQSYSYFKRQKWNLDIDIYSWRSVGVSFTTRYIHGWFFGKQILSFIYWLENTFSHLAGRFGQYPLFVIKK